MQAKGFRKGRDGRDSRTDRDSEIGRENNFFPNLTSLGVAREIVSSFYILLPVAFGNATNNKMCVKVK